jgi:uncharacterized protein (TIGR03067 family)
MSLAMLGLVLVLGFSQAADDNKDEWKKLNGTWSVKEGEANGTALPADGLAKLKLTMKDGTYVVKADDATDKGNLKLDPKKKPKEVDVEGVDGPNMGKTYKAIYEIDGDTLKVCYDLGGTDRPKEFKTKVGSTEMLLIFTRDK